MYIFYSLCLGNVDCVVCYKVNCVGGCMFKCYFMFSG